MNSNDQIPSNNPSPSKKSFTKKILISLAILISLLIIFAGILPTIISTKWGNDQLISLANHRIPGTLSANKISISWLGPQAIEEASLKDPEGNVVLSLEKGFSQSSLISLILNNFSPSGLSIDSLSGTISTDAQGNTNLKKALDSTCCRSKVAQADKPVSISFKNVNALINLDANKAPLAMHLTGETFQDTQSGKFAIDAELKGIDYKQLLKIDQQTLNQLKASGKIETKVKADIVNFPVALADQFIALKHPKCAGIAQELLGQQFNLTLNQSGAPQGLELKLNAKSSQMTANIEAIINDKASLKQPSKINLKITPQLIAKLNSFSNNPFHWKLKSPTSIEVTINSLEYPISSLDKQFFTDIQELDLDPLTLNAEFKLQPASFSQNKESTLDLQDLNGKVQLTAAEPVGTISLTGKATYNSQPFAINLGSQLTKPRKLRDLLNNIFQYTNIQADIKGLPIQAIGSGLGINNPLVQAMGNAVDLNISLQSEKNTPTATVRLKSDFLEVPPLSFTLGNEISLTKPSIAKVYISPSLIEKVLNLNSKGPRLRDTASALIKINKLSFPREQIGYLPDHVAIDGDISFSSMLVSQLPVINDASLNDFNLHIAGNSLSHAVCSLTGTISPLEDQGPLKELIGGSAKISATTQLNLNPNKAAVDAVNVKVVSNLAQLNLIATLGEDNALILKNPAIINYTLTSGAFKALGISSFDNFVINQGVPLELKISKLLIPLDPNELSRLLTVGDVKIKDLSISHKFDKNFPPAILDKLDLHWILDAKSNMIKFDFDGVTRLGQQENQGSFSGNGSIDQWTLQNSKLNFDQAKVRFKTNAYKLPTAFFNAFLKETDLTALIGNYFDSNIAAEMDLSSKSSGTLSLNINSEMLSGTGNFKFNEGILLSDPTKPAKLNITLTPKGYAVLRPQALQESMDLALSEPVQISLLLKGLSLPLKSSAGSTVPYWNSAIDLDLYIDKLVGINRKNQNRITLNGVKGHVFSENIAQHTAFDLRSDGETNANVKTSLSIVGSLDNGFTNNGLINRNALSLNLDATLANLPITLLCQLICQDLKLEQKLDAVVGSNLDAKIKAQLQQMNGPLYVEIKGSHGHTVLDGQLSNGVLKLNNNFYAELTVTPQLGKHVLQDLIPFLSGMLGSDQPLKLAIAKEGFALPLGQFSPENISIGGATLELGKVRFSNDGQLAKVLSLLTTASSNEIMVWLTPTYFSLNNGLFSLQRVDMLISDRYPIAAWGKVNIPADNVNMVIGLSGAAISKAFSVPGIKKGFMLQLPLRGTMKNTTIDKSKAIARLSALVAQSQGGPQGMVLGTVLDIASGGLSEDAVPQPTTKPLPWNSMMEEASEGSNTQTPIQEINKVVPIEEIGKGAGNLLKKIFNK